MNTTTIHKIETHTGYANVEWSDTLNGKRRFHHLYFKGKDGYYFNYRGEYHAQKEHRQPIIVALNQLEWAEGRDCLATAPWLTTPKKVPHPNGIITKLQTLKTAGISTKRIDGWMETVRSWQAGHPHHIETLAPWERAFLAALGLKPMPTPVAS